MENYKYYIITNNVIEQDDISCTFHGSWSSLWIDTDLTNKEEAIALFERAVSEDYRETLKSYNKDSITIEILECICPTDEDDELVFEEQDSILLDSKTIYLLESDSNRFKEVV